MRINLLPPTFISLFLILGTLSTEAVAQDDSTEDVLKVSVEEVRIPVAAYDAGGRFDPTLSVDDLLVREDGEAQRVTAVLRLPAHVLVRRQGLIVRSRRGYVAKLP